MMDECPGDPRGVILHRLQPPCEAIHHNSGSSADEARVAVDLEDPSLDDPPRLVIEDDGTHALMLSVHERPEGWRQ
jgi:hypothetical protein